MPRSMRPSIRDANAVDGNYEEELGEFYETINGEKGIYESILK